MKPYLILVLIIWSFVCKAQGSKDSLVVVRLKVWDEINKMPIENIQVISYETTQVFITDEEGSLRSTFSISDSLRINGIGYSPYTLKVSDFVGQEGYRNFYLERTSIMIREVDVAPHKELALHMPDDIKVGVINETPPALRNDGYSSKPGVVAAVLTPASFAYYHLSKSEKQKRNARKKIAESKEQDKISMLYNREIVAEVSGYEGELLDEFMIYCNVHLKLKSSDNQLLVKQQIVELKKAFEDEKRNR